MANQEVVNAINETMVPNGVKAINADSVRNLLLLMAEKMGEGTGTGSGAVRVHFSEGQDLDFSQVNFEDVGPFTPEEVELIKNMMAKAQQDNKAAYKLLNEHREQGIADLVMGDDSLFLTVMLIGMVRLYEDILGQFDPEYSGVDWSAFSYNAVATFPMVYLNGKTDTSGIDGDSLALLDTVLEDVFGRSDASFLNGISLGYDITSSAYYSLKEDGSVFYIGDNYTTYDRLIYVPWDGVELTEDEINANKEAYDNLPILSEIGHRWSIRVIELVGDKKYDYERGGYIHEASKLSNSDTSYSYGRFWKEKDMWEVRVYEDGTATLEVYASINPTATE